jgi:hypothetical protein
VVYVALSTFSAQQLSGFWGDLVPVTAFRTKTELPRFIALLGGHMRFIEHFVAAVAGRDPVASVPWNVLRDDFQRNILTAAAPTLKVAYLQAVELLRKRYNPDNGARHFPQLVAVVLSHCPVDVDDVLDAGLTVEQLLSWAPITFINTSFITMPLGLVSMWLSDANSPQLSSLLDMMFEACSADSTALASESERLTATFFALLRVALSALPTKLQGKRLAEHYPSAIFESGSDNVTLDAHSYPPGALGRDMVVFSKSKFPYPSVRARKTQKHPTVLVDQWGRELTDALTVHGKVVINGAQAPFADILTFFPNWRALIQNKGLGVGVTTGKSTNVEVRKVVMGLDFVKSIDTRKRQDVFVMVSSGVFVDAAQSTAPSVVPVDNAAESGGSSGSVSEKLPVVAFTRNHGLEELLGVFMESAALNTAGCARARVCVCVCVCV